MTRISSSDSARIDRAGGFFDLEIARTQVNERRSEMFACQTSPQAETPARQDAGHLIRAIRGITLADVLGVVALFVIVIGASSLSVLQ